jgi:hypothetical protein
MHIKELQVGVDVRGQARVGVPHCGLSRPQGDAPPLLKRVPKVVRSACTLSVRPRSSHFGIPAARKSRSKTRTIFSGTLKSGKAAGSRAGIGLPPGFRLKSGELVGEPVPKIVGKIGSHNDAVSFTVLLVGGVEFDVRHGTVEPQLRHGEARQFVPSQPR